MTGRKDMGEAKRPGYGPFSCGKYDLTQPRIPVGAMMVSQNNKGHLVAGEQEEDSLEYQVSIIRWQVWRLVQMSEVLSQCG
jgi:hypothetical protein